MTVSCVCGYFVAGSDLLKQLLCKLSNDVVVVDAVVDVVVSIVVLLVVEVV